jgi:hypothetical protein
MPESLKSPPPHPGTSALPQDVICPGAKNLFPGEGPHYLRLVFTAYWDGAPPSTEIFYITKHKFHLSLKGISMLEDEIMALMATYDTPAPLSVTYVTYCGVELDEDDVTTLGWRLISG